MSQVSIESDQIEEIAGGEFERAGILIIKDIFNDISSQP